MTTANPASAIGFSVPKASPLAETIAAYMAARVARHEGELAQLASAAGLSAGTITLVRQGSRGLGLNSICALAQAWGESLGDIERAALEWEARGRPSLDQAPVADPYPNRQRAALFARYDYSEAAIAAVRLVEPTDHRDHPASWWLDQIVLEQARQDRALPNRSTKPSPATRVKKH